MKIISSIRLTNRRCGMNIDGHMMHIFSSGILLFCLLVLQAGCSEQDNDQQQGHVWQEQTRHVRWRDCCRTPPMSNAGKWNNKHSNRPPH